MARQGKNPIPEEVYTSKETMQKLGISSSTLKSLVDKNIIQRVVPPGYKQGYYTKKSVDEYYNQFSAFNETYQLEKEKKLEVRKAKIEEQPLIFELERKILGATIPVERRIEWYNKNPDIDFVAISNNNVLGHLSLLPLEERTLKEQVSGKIRGWDITAESIERYEAGKEYNLFIMAMAVQKELPNSSIYAALLLREAQRFLCDLADKSILIKAIYATSRTRDGIYLAQRMLMDIIPEWTTTHHKAFILDINKSNSYWAKSYREHLASLKQPTTHKS